jgi:hypothetical protein
VFELFIKHCTPSTRIVPAQLELYHSTNISADICIRGPLARVCINAKEKTPENADQNTLFSFFSLRGQDAVDFPFSIFHFSLQNARL